MVTRRIALDAIDVRILGAVQRHGQLSKARLSEIVNLSPSPCLARLRRLTEAGYILGYHADIALGRVCEVTQVVVTVSLAQHRRSDFARFEAHIHAREEITDCVATGGGTDYVFRAVCPGMAAFQELMDALLAAELGIERYMTYIVTREVKATRPNIEALAARARLRP